MSQASDRPSGRVESASPYPAQMRDSDNGSPLIRHSCVQPGRPRPPTSQACLLGSVPGTSWFCAISAWCGY